MMVNHDETTRLVQIQNNIPNRPNSHPIPANRLALDAQIQAASEYQQRLRRRRRVYYIVLISSVTMLTFGILSFVAWIIHNSAGKANLVAPPSLMVEAVEVLDNSSSLSSQNLNFLNARKIPTRTIRSEDEQVRRLVKRSEMESDEEKDDNFKKVRNKSVKRNPTRTHKLSYAPEKIVDYMAKNQ